MGDEEKRRHDEVEIRQEVSDGILRSLKKKKSGKKWRRIFNVGTEI